MITLSLRPFNWLTEVFDFATREAKLDAAACPVGSEPEMTKGVLQIPVW